MKRGDFRKDYEVRNHFEIATMNAVSQIILESEVPREFMSFMAAS
jgi:hypothetical protein